MLVRDPCVACVPARHPFASLGSITIAQSVEESIVAASGDNIWRDYWILSSYRHKPARFAYEAATFEAELQAVSLGCGPSVVPASAARFYAQPGVRFVPIADMPPCEVSVAFLETAPQAAVNVVSAKNDGAGWVRHHEPHPPSR